MTYKFLTARSPKRFLQCSRRVQLSQYQVDLKICVRIASCDGANFAKFC